MNIKFRMPRLGHTSKSPSVFREITLTTIATTISIILTFGTAHFIEVKQKRAAGRQTAMIVIHDMENSIKAFREMAKDEEKYRDMTQRVMERKEEIDSLDEETAWKIFIYISTVTDEQNLYNLDESSERVFLSSQDSWKNINNAAFIDVVQDFYAYRHEVYDYMNTSIQWQKPISSKVLYQHQLNHEDGSSDIYELLKETLPCKEVLYYLNYSNGRQTQLNQFADQMQHFSDVCKFNMGITDEELEEYVRNSNRTGRDVKERELVGRWVQVSTDEQTNIIEFFKDKTYTQTVITHLSHPMYIGRIDLIYTSKGTWQLHDDTLRTVLQPQFKFEMDHRQITPKRGYEQEVAEFVEKYRIFGRQQEQSSGNGEVRRRSYLATICNSGNKIELKWTEHDDNNDDHETTIYLSRDDN